MTFVQFWGYWARWHFSRAVFLHPSGATERVAESVGGEMRRYGAGMLR